MELNEYQELSTRTRKAGQTKLEAASNYALGLAGEAGEVANVVKKHVFHGRTEEETAEKVLDESGDTLWYLSQTLETYGLTLEQAARHNLAKLKARYPDGFSEEASRNRKV